jgi:putative ABC transport system ATP-binding protein
MNTPTLQLQNVSKTFHAGTVNECAALRDVSLTLDKGDFVMIIGSNGAGKSTLFNAICGSFEPDGGRILLNGADITRMPDYRRALSIGRLFQDPMRGTSPNLTVEENLSLAYGRKARRSFFALNKHNSRFFQDRLAQLDLGLEDRMTTKIGLLSGGQRQAVALLMCTIAQPQVLLLDEHTAALDPATAKKVLDITVDIVEQTQTATMMITHDVRAALSTGNRTIMMDAGRILMDMQGETRQAMTLNDLLSLYTQQSKRQLLNDRMLFELAK